VALVGPNGHVALTGIAVRLTGTEHVHLVDGTIRDHGHLLRLKQVRTYPETVKLKMRWRVVGQFRYFDVRKWAPIILGTPVGGGAFLDPSDTPSERTLPRLKFFGGIPGMPLNAPEAKLVRSYVSWLRGGSEFEHHYLRAERLHTDLFDRSKWRLIEAKIHDDRLTLRSAVGQLLDYKRWYIRKPSLGILLASRPSYASIEYLRQCGITTIWRTPSGRFFDSTDNHGWTSGRRYPRLTAGTT
jgi:hypothetical protein